MLPRIILFPLGRAVHFHESGTNLLLSSLVKKWHLEPELAGTPSLFSEGILISLRVSHVEPRQRLIFKHWFWGLWGPKSSCAYDVLLLAGWSGGGCSLTADHGTWVVELLALGRASPTGPPFPTLQRGRALWPERAGGLSCCPREEQGPWTDQPHLGLR